MPEVTQAALSLFRAHTVAQIECWAIYRPDGSSLFFTSNTEPVSWGGMKFLPSSSARVADSDFPLGAGEGSTGASTVAREGFATFQDINAERLRGAQIEEYIFDANAVWAGPIENNTYDLREASYQNGTIEVEAGSLGRRLADDYGDRYSRNCRYQKELGDPYTCKADVVTRSVYSTVITAVTTQTQFTCATIAGQQADSWFSWGRATITNSTDPTLDNFGVERMIVDSVGASGEITVFQPFPFAIQAGDLVDLIVGCNGLEPTCLNKFGNLVNHGGKPDTPGADSSVN